MFLGLILNSCRGCSSVRHRNIDETDELSQDLNIDAPNVSRENRKAINFDSQTSSVVKMKKESGVYKVPVEIDGVNMEFIFDTGASFISISETEALFLYKQGKLKEEDFLGNVEFTDANGDISEGTIINLRSVKIGNKTIYNIEASVVHNQKAPLLFGQSAMKRFGKITMDYSNNTITFDK